MDRQIFIWTAYGFDPEPIISSNNTGQGAPDSVIYFNVTIDPVLVVTDKVNLAPYIFSHPALEAEAKDGVRAIADDTSAICMLLRVFRVLVPVVSYAFYLVGLRLNGTKI